MLRLKDVTYITPPPRTKRVLEDASMEIKREEHTVIYGDNGSGKTTLLKLFLGLLEPVKGRVDGGLNKAAAVFEFIDEQLLFSTVNEELKSINTPADEVYNILKIDELNRRSTLELSFTEKVRLIFYLSYAVKKDYLMLDSPVQDYLIEKAIKNILNKKESTLVLFSPPGRGRDYCSGWKKYRIEDNKVKEYRGN